MFQSNGIDILKYMNNYLFLNNMQVINLALLIKGGTNN